MATSQAEDWQVTCAACGTVSVAQLWGLIDALERPDLLDRVRARTLRTHCNHTSQLPDVFLLLYRGPDHNLMFTSTDRQTMAYQEWTA